MIAVLRALIIGGSPDFRRFVRAILETEGFECVEALNNTDALNFASESGIDLIVADGDTPRPGDHDLLSIVANGVFGVHAPPLILSCRQSHLKRRFPANGFGPRPISIVKPFEPRELTEALAAALPDP